MRPIDGDALVEHLEKQSEAYNEIYNKFEAGNPSQDIMYGKYTSIVETMIDVRHMPTIDCEPVTHSKWKYYHKQNKAVCMACSFERDLDENFGAAVCCPNCGAKMDGGKDNA